MSSIIKSTKKNPELRIFDNQTFQKPKISCLGNPNNYLHAVPREIGTLRNHPCKTTLNHLIIYIEDVIPVNSNGVTQITIHEIA